MRKLIFLMLVLFCYNLSAQEIETIEASDRMIPKQKKKENQAERQKSIRENWLKAKGRSQSAEDKIRKKGDQKYDKLGYMASMDKYNQLNASEGLDRELMIRMANSYRLNGNTMKSEYWYSKVANHMEKPEDVLRFAQVLQSNGKCEDALRWYRKYNEMKKDDIDDGYAFIKDCDEIKTFTDNKEIEINNLTSINTDGLDFSCRPYKDGLIFTSTRNSNKAIVNKDSWSNDNFTDLYFAEMDEQQEIKKISRMSGDINGKYHDGVATFDQSESVMFFSRNSAEGKSRKGLIDLKIYFAYNYDSYWSNVRPLVFNSEEFATTHPTLSSDGNRLYFSSDRPGGYGGMDIYVSVFDGTNWGEVTNLGPDINSAGNELFPTVASDDVLYFSSNGHKGLGGSDIFMATKAEEEDEGSWGNRKNMGTPFNSAKDDFGFYINDEKTGGYLSSDRVGGKGGDDIYRWTGNLNNEDLVSKKLICVYDKETLEKLTAVTVTVSDSDDIEEEYKVIAGKMSNLSEEQQEEDSDSINQKSKEQSFETNENGQFLFAAQRGKVYTVRVEKADYVVKEIEVDWTALTETEDYCIELEKQKCQKQTIIVMDGNKNSPLPEAQVTIINTSTEEKEVLSTRMDGTVRACLPCGYEYKLEANKSLFNYDYKTINVDNRDCYKSRGEDIIMTLSLLKPIQSKPEPVADTDEMRKLKQHFLGDPNSTFYVGQIITLEDIYYDYDKWNIRADAAAKLDKISQLLEAYPTMEIEMMSHTDSRGKSTYNSSLSVKRARSAMLYIVRSGIASFRLTSQGYGERKLTNHCADGVSCSESEHQKNRRTEIRIRRL